MNKKAELLKKILATEATLRELKFAYDHLKVVNNNPLDSYSLIKKYLRDNQLEYIRGSFVTSTSSYVSDISISFSNRIRLYNTSIALNHFYNADETEYIFELYTNNDDYKITITSCRNNHYFGVPIFNSRKGADHALRILGEENIKNALYHE